MLMSHAAVMEQTNLGTGPVARWVPGPWKSLSKNLNEETGLATLVSGGKALQAGGAAWAQALLRTCLVCLRNRWKADMAAVC